MGPSPEILGPTFGRDPSFVPEDTPRSRLQSVVSSSSELTLAFAGTGKAGHRAGISTLTEAPSPSPQRFTWIRDRSDWQRERIPPALYVDINLGPGKVGRIGLHQDSDSAISHARVRYPGTQELRGFGRSGPRLRRGDDPSVLAENFCKTYSLNETTKAKLTGMLRQQLDMITVDM
eukprot:3936279-Rhodomonas_salina.1